MLDRAALVRGIQDGTIEVVATDHAPHSEAEKAKGLAGSAFGIVGLETAFPVLYTRRAGRCSVARKTCGADERRPWQAFGLAGQSLRALRPTLPLDLGGAVPEEER
ncbi:MAG: hypothetical protein ACLUZZ_03410 [Alistipes inops]